MIFIKRGVKLVALRIVKPESAYIPCLLGFRYSAALTRRAYKIVSLNVFFILTALVREKELKRGRFY